eukprot:CCRYP_011639-RB/>CCRYP_011639-RB protein AED:0.02 eAED:0.02 QI:111/1/1/1/1/1/2/524/145
MSCLFCFSSDKLSPDERKGKYGDVWGQYADNDNQFKVKLCGAPCAEPCCWMGSMICFPCAQYKLRHMALNHVSPGSGWSNYTCCQSMFGGCCCIQPGNLGEDSCPQVRAASILNSVIFFITLTFFVISTLSVACVVKHAAALEWQ